MSPTKIQIQNNYLIINWDDEETSILDDIHTVEISLTVREPAGKDKIISRTYSTRVICRNLGF